MKNLRATGILLITCSDQKGLVAAVSDFVARHGGNIVHADQHTDLEAQVFVQRVEFELDGLDLARDEIAPAFAPLASRFGMDWKLRFSDEPRRMAILVSRRGHCLCDLISRWRMGELRVEIPLVISNHDDLQPIAEEVGIAFHHLPVDDANRSDQERSIRRLLTDNEIDLVVLARYMQILGEGLLGAYPGRIINIHHSFLPAFAGARPYHRAHDRGVKVIGATAHYVTAELDEGPIIEQDVVRVSHRNSVRDMIHKGRDLEKTVLARAVAMHLANRVVVYGTKTAIFE